MLLFKDLGKAVDKVDSVRRSMPTVLRETVSLTVSIIDEDEDDSGGDDVRPDFSRDTPFVELILPKTASVGEPKCVEDTNPVKMLRVLIKLITPGHTTIPLLLVSS